MTIADSSRILGRWVYHGGLSGKDVVLAESGIGMTNAAMTTQAMLDRFHPKAVIFSGIAGGIDSSVHIGDITSAGRGISTTTDTTAKTAFKYPGSGCMTRHGQRRPDR